MCAPMSPRGCHSRTGPAGSLCCTDAFHLFRDKQVVMKELNRVTMGPIMLVTVRNGNVPYRHTRFPLTPKEYAELAGRSHRIVADAEVLSRYLQRKGPALSRQP